MAESVVAESANAAAADPRVAQNAAGNVSSGCTESDDVARLRDSSCTAAHPEACAEHFVLLRFDANDKYLAPREKGVVYAAVRRRFRTAGTVPLARLAWRVVPQKNGWVQLQHVLTGRFLRLVPPPSDEAWMVRAEVSSREYDKETWFKIELPDGNVFDLGDARVAKSPTAAYLKAHVRGAYINYRMEDIIRGHGNSPLAGEWRAAAKLDTTKLSLETVPLAALLADGRKWAAWRQACFAPCSDPEDAALLVRQGGAGWSEVCWKHFAEPTCNAILRAHEGELRRGGRSMSPLLRVRWARLDCEKYVNQMPVQTLPVDPWLPGSAAAMARDALAPHCAPLVQNTLLLLVSDRPNQFLCHYLESALLHGLQPTVLGWDAPSWTVGNKKPWTYHLGAKLVLPLEYLRRCQYPDDALVLFTDHDVIFQGGYAEFRQAYAKVAAQAGGARGRAPPLVFSAEADSYPLELKELYPKRPTDRTSGPHEHLNSGMWMGRIGDAKQLLESMTGVRRGEKIETLLRHYHFWGALDTNVDPIPAAYTENDQTKYAGIYVAQEMAASCNEGIEYESKGHGCFTFLHDGARRCSPGCHSSGARQHSERHSMNTHARGDHVPEARARRAAGRPQAIRKGAPAHLPQERARALPLMALDRSNTLFVNVFHAGSDRDRLGVHKFTLGADGRLRRGAQTPVAMHYNGPAKVVFEAAWGLEQQWDPHSGKTPVLLHLEGLRNGMPPEVRAAAVAAFERNVTFIDPWLQRAPSIGPLRFSCDVPAA